MGRRVIIIFAVMGVFLNISCDMDLLGDLEEIQEGPPDNTASGVSFTDVDEQENEIQGDIYITQALDESDIYKYVIYWGSDSASRLGGSIAELDKTGEMLTYTLNANTPIRDGATHFLVFSKNMAGEMNTCVSITINDLKGPPPTHKASSIGFTDEDLIYRKLSGNIQINTASDQSDITHYVLYWAIDPYIRIGEPFAVLETQVVPTITTPLYQYTIPSAASYILVITRNENGEMLKGVSCAIFDRYPMIIYNGNGHTSGSPPVDASVYNLNEITLVYGNPGSMLRINDGGTSYKYDGWNTQANGLGTSYNSGDPITVNDVIILYTQWSPYAIGDKGPGNGMIFYTGGNYTTNGWRYMEVAPQSTEWNIKGWGAYGYDLGTGSGIGDGRNNTRNAAEWMDNHSFTATPVQRCRDLVYGGYSDWFLPARDTMSEIGTALSGGFQEDEYYWSSTESNPNYNYIDLVCLDDVDFDNDLKNSSAGHYARAVRRF
jgi:hypothetical protein